MGAGPRQDRRNLPQNRQSKHSLRHGCGRIAKAIMSPGVSIRTSFLSVLITPKILHGSEPRCDDLAHYTEWASEGLAHHFAVESDELRLKTNVRGGPLSARCCGHQRANNCDRRRFRDPSPEPLATVFRRAAITP